MRVTLLVAMTLVAIAGCGDDAAVVPEAPVPPAYLGQWGSPGSGPGEFRQPSEITIGPRGSVWVLDHQNARLQQFDPDGTYLREWGGEIEAGIFFTPLINAFAIHGDRVYVSDILVSRTYVLTLEGQLLDVWDYFAVHGGLAVEADGTVLLSGFRVIDRGPPVRIEGPYLWRLGPEGQKRSSQDLDLRAIALDRDGFVHGITTRVVNGLPRAAVVKVSPEGDILRRWETGEESTVFDDLAVDGAGNVYVANRPNQSIYKFSRFGHSGSGPGFLVGWNTTDPEGRPFSWPAGIAIDDHNRIYVSDFDQDRVVRFDSR